MSAIWLDDGGSVSAVTYIDAASSTGSTITIPATAQAGDVAVLYDVAFISGSPAPTLVVPSGWANQVDEVLTTVARFAVHTKILTGSDPGAIITGMNGADSNDKLLLVFRPNGPVASLTASTFTKEFVNTDPSSQVIAANGSTPPVIVLGGCSSVGATPVAFSTASPAFDATVASANADLLMGYKFYNDGSTPASHTIDTADLGSRNTLWGGYLTLQ